VRDGVAVQEARKIVVPRSMHTQSPIFEADYARFYMNELTMTENEKNTTPVNLKDSQFPSITSELVPKHSLQFRECLDNLNRGLRQRQILNPAYNYMKQTFNSVVERAYEKTIQRPHVRGKLDSMPRSYQDLYWDVSASSLHSCKAALKKVNSPKFEGEMIEAMRAFFKEVEPLIQAMDEVKGYVVKRDQLRAEMAEAKKSAYTPPSVDDVVKRAIYDVLSDITQRHYVRLVGYFKHSFESDIKRFLEGNVEERKKLIANPYTRAGIVEMLDIQRDSFAVRPDGKERLQVLAEREALSIQESFIFKNLRKLASIVEAKDNLDCIKEIGSTVDLGGLTGSLHIAFKDGSEFSVANSVVWSTSIYGKQFLRFPLTFHDVVMPNGEKMGMPSEERMNKIFAPVGEVSVDDLVSEAAGRFAEGEDGFVESGKASWALNPHFSLKRFGPLIELKDRFLVACAKAEEEGFAGRYDDMVGQDIHTPIIVLEKDGKLFVWDGDVRIGAAARNGKTTIPAIVGTAIPELTLEHQQQSHSSTLDM